MTIAEKEIEMTTPNGLPDVRWALTAAQDWVGGLLDGVDRTQWSRPTPCTEYDVEALIKHLFGVADRVIAMGGGAPAESVPAFVQDLPDDLVADYRGRVEQGRRAWADDASLARPVAAPWGTMPGAIVATVYVAEIVTHGWDLAVATGQDSEADPAQAAIGVADMQRALPADGRDGYPFAPPVTPEADAGPTERLANWSGHARPAIHDQN